MRQLKFRAFDKTKQVWINGTNKNGFHIIGEHTMFDVLNQYKIENFSNIHIEQFTGLKDKNGIDVYEGDIVSFNRSYGSWANPERYGRTTDVCEVIFDSEECFRFALKYKSNIQKLRKHWNYKYEILGNIHENPELIK